MSAFHFQATKSAGMDKWKVLCPGICNFSNQRFNLFYLLILANTLGGKKEEGGGKGMEGDVVIINDLAIK